MLSSHYNFPNSINSWQSKRRMMIGKYNVGLQPSPSFSRQQAETSNNDKRGDTSSAPVKYVGLLYSTTHAPMHASVGSSSTMSSLLSSLFLFLVEKFKFLAVLVSIYSWKETTVSVTIPTRSVQVLRVVISLSAQDQEQVAWA